MADWDEPPMIESYALDKVREVLILQEIRMEDRNGTFFWMIVMGIGFAVGSVFRYNSELSAGRYDAWSGLSFFGWVLLAIAGVTLRIYNQFELRHVRRLLKIASMNKFPS